MKLQTKLSDFEKLVKAGMIYKSKAYISPTNLQFSKDSLTIADTYSDIMAVYITVKKDFFTKYEAESEVIPFTTDLLDKLSWGFSDTLTIETKKDKIYLTDGKTNYSTDLEEHLEKQFPFKMKETEHGIIPEKIEPESAVTLTVDQLKFPNADSYFFEISKNKLIASIKGVGEWKTQLDAKFIGKKDILIAVDADFFNAITNNLSDEVTLIFRETAVILAQKTDNLTKTYLLATQNIEE